jgi:hypothetical protein
MRKIYIIGSITILAIVVLWVGLTVLENARFRVVSTNPALSQINSASGSIDMYFNKPLNKNSVSIRSKSNIVDNYSITGTKTLHIVWNTALVTGKEYSFTITKISDISGSSITNKVISFTVISTDNQSPSQQQAAVNSQDNVAPADKIYGFLPYYTTYYTLDAEPNGNQKPSILFTYLPAPSYLPADQIAATPSESQAESDAQAWLTGKGIDLSQYQFNVAPVTSD